MKTQIIMILILFFISTGKAFAIDITLDNYRNFIGKHLLLIPNKPLETSYYAIEGKTFDDKKYLGKPLLIKDIETNLQGITKLILEEKNNKGKDRNITIKIPVSKKRFTTFGFGIQEDLEEAKKFFIGKTLFADASSSFSSAKIYSLRFSLERDAQKGTPYNIIEVEQESETSFRLIINDSQYILSYKKDSVPYNFTFIAPTTVSEKSLLEATREPEKYYITHREDKLENVLYTEISSSLNTKNKYDSISFGIVLPTKNKVKLCPRILLKYASDSWLFINGATLYIDGKKTSLSLGNRDSDVYEDTEGNIVHEKFYFETTKKQIQDIARGKSVTLRLLGDKGYVDGAFTKQNLYNINRFYDEEIK